MKKKKNKTLIYTLLGSLISIFLFLFVGFYNKLETTNYKYLNSKLPKEFDGFRILLISDLHCAIFGQNQEELISAIEKSNPDIIALTGDILDAYHTDLNGIEPFLAGIQAIAPAYAISGNHELAVPALHKQLLALYQTYGIVDLDDQTTTIEHNGASIQLHGLKWFWDISQTLPVADTSKFSILLYHGTNNFDIIKKYNYDLVLAGHTHGGIVRIPFIGGVFGNSGEFFPKYDSGVFSEKTSTMISSRGLGDTPPVPRFLNRPELVSITLNTEN